MSATDELRSKGGGSMSATEERKSCIDCEFFDTEAGNIYGVCVKESYIDTIARLHCESFDKEDY